MNPLAPPTERSRFNVIGEVVAEYIAVSFWALLWTASLTAFHFNQFSMVGLIANAVAVPIMGFGSVISGLVAAALSFVAAHPRAIYCGWLANSRRSARVWLDGSSDGR